MLLSLTLLAAILSATIAIPRPDGAVDPAALSSPADAFMTQAPAGDPNVLALADSANCWRQWAAYPQMHSHRQEIAWGKQER